MSPAAIKISDSLQQGLDSFFGFLPNLLAFLLILVIGYVIAKLVAGILRKALQKAGLDKALHESDAKQYVDRVSPDASPSAAIGRVFFYIVFVFVLTAAIGALKIPAVTAFMNQVLAYLPNVIVAIVIFVAAAAIAGAVAGGVAKLMGDTPTGKIVATAVPSLVMRLVTPTARARSRRDRSRPTCRRARSAAKSRPSAAGDAHNRRCRETPAQGRRKSAAAASRRSASRRAATCGGATSQPPTRARSRA